MSSLPSNHNHKHSKVESICRPILGCLGESLIFAAGPFVLLTIINYANVGSLEGRLLWKLGMNEFQRTLMNILSRHGVSLPELARLTGYSVSLLESIVTGKSARCP